MAAGRGSAHVPPRGRAALEAGGEDQAVQIVVLAADPHAGLVDAFHTLAVGVHKVAGGHVVSLQNGNPWAALAPDRQGKVDNYPALAGIALGLEAYDPRRVHGSALSQAALDDLVGRLAGMTPEAIAFLPSLDPARAPVLLGGAIVAGEALRRSGRTEVVVSEADLLDGIARRLAGVV